MVRTKTPAFTTSTRPIYNQTLRKCSFSYKMSLTMQTIKTIRNAFLICARALFGKGEFAATI